MNTPVASIMRVEIIPIDQNGYDTSPVGGKCNDHEYGILCPI